MTLVQPPADRASALADDVVPDRAPPRRTATGRTARMLALLGCLAALVALYVVAVHTGIGQRVDNAAVLHHHLDRTPDADVGTSDHILLLATVLLVPLVLWCGRRDRRKLIVNVCAAAGSVLVAELSRELLQRPYLGRFDPLYGASFPSGHAAAAMGSALALVAVADGTWVRRLVPVVPGFVAAFALAVPIHRPSDLIAGYVVALAIMSAADSAVGSSARPASVPRSPIRWWRVALLRTIGLTVILLVAEAVVLRHAHLTSADLGPGFPLGVLAVVGGAELTIGAYRLARTRW